MVEDRGRDGRRRVPTREPVEDRGDVTVVPLGETRTVNLSTETPPKTGN